MPWVIPTSNAVHLSTGLMAPTLPHYVSNPMAIQRKYPFPHYCLSLNLQLSRPSHPSSKTYFRKSNVPLIPGQTLRCSNPTVSTSPQARVVASDKRLTILHPSTTNTIKFHSTPLHSGELPNKHSGGPPLSIINHVLQPIF